MKKFSAAAIIHAKPERIWSILTDADHFGVRNELRHRDWERAARVELNEEFDFLAGTDTPLHAVEGSVPRRIAVWSGGMPLGLFKGERTFSLAQVSPDAVEFSMTEIFSGLFSPLIERSLPDMQPAFEEFALRLKECAEKEV